MLMLMLMVKVNMGFASTVTAAAAAAIWMMLTMLSLQVQGQLSVNYYVKSCPNVEALVHGVVKQKYFEAPVSAPGTIRMLFHDCFVEGCDASLLISSTQNQVAERDAFDNKNIPDAAFDAIIGAKAAVEAKCPGIVSCADILAIATRDFIVLTGGPYYQVNKGRKDGRISLASRVQGNLPRTNVTVDQLLKIFASKGLNRSDMVALSGAHTIGFSHCNAFLDRLYNYRKSNKPDPSMHPKLLKALKMSCPVRGGNADITAPFDVNTPFAFDNMYYKNLQTNLGLLETDQGLLSHPQTKSLVNLYAQSKTLFFHGFTAAMDKMSLIAVKTATQGEVRKDCTRFNAKA